MGAVMSGARAKVGIFDPATGLTRIIGIYSSVDYGVNYNTEAAFTLGRFSAAANDFTGMDIIRLTCTGFRIIKHGPWVETGLPKLQDLLLSDYIQLAIIDRQTELLNNGDARMAKFFYVRCTGFTGGMDPKALSKMTVHYEATFMGDESTDNAEGAGATILPTT